MKKEKIMNAIGGIDDEMIYEAGKQPAVKRRGSLKKWMALAAAFALVLTGALTAFTLIGKNRVAATVALDVNPSIEIEINNDERVLEVKALNNDAVKVIGDMNLKKVDLEVAVNALIGSMLKNGYISIDKNSIMVSVDSDNNDMAGRLQGEISDTIEKTLGESKINASIITQLYSKEEEVNNGQSAAKHALVDKIIRGNITDTEGKPYERERLLGMTVNELKVVLESLKLEVEGVQSTGNASVTAYIGEEKALEIAYNHAGIDKTAATEVVCKLDFDDGIMMYEVEFKCLGTEYDYEINAKTGEIIEAENEPDDDYAADKPVTAPDGFITENEALEKAYTAAGVDKSKVYDVSCELDRENGRDIYEVEFETDAFEYSYDIDAKSGEVIHFERENKADDDDKYDDKYDDKDDKYDDKDDDKDDDKNISENGIITRSEALEKAYTAAGVDKSKVYDVSCELDIEYGKRVYEVEFETNTFEYSYEIDAETGKIIKAEKENRD